jgi:predicted ATP-dependent endonuclease of OLD family
MIKSITLKFGSVSAKPKLQFEILNVTVFIGPNNSGKSLGLQEIQQFVDGQRFGKIIAQIDFEAWSAEAFGRKIDSLRVEPVAHEKKHFPNAIILETPKRSNETTVRSLFMKDLLLTQGATGDIEMHGQYSRFLSLFTLKLDGVSRLSLVADGQVQFCV